MFLYGHKSSILLVALTLTLSACAVGPDFKPPAAPTVKNYTMTKMSKALTAGHGEPKQNLKLGNAVSSQWWELFHSRQLDDVVTQSIKRNQTLAAAKATLAQAQEAVWQAVGPLYPQIDANASAERFKGPGPVAPSNLYIVGATVNYVADVFGGTRRTIEQQVALAENQRYQLGAAYLTLTGNVVTQSIALATLRARLVAVEHIIASDKKNLQLVQDKLQAGKAARIDVLTAQSQLANDSTQLAPILQLISVTQHSISVLVGQFPGEWAPPPFDLATLTLPTELPLSVPSALVHQRPDILAAEATLHANSAAIGVATAQLYPTITLSGSMLAESIAANTLFTKSNLLWNTASGLTAPIFYGGALMAQKQQAVYAYQASLATYRQTVLQAFSQVADTLRALKNDGDLLKAQKEALDTATESLALQRISYAAGKSDLLLLLFAERSYQQARLGFVQALGQRYQDTAQLFLAMGGGWWCGTKM